MNNIIKALNLTDGAVLTLEKMPDRMEFEAVMTMLSSGESHNKENCLSDTCTILIVCKNCYDYCECVGPKNYSVTPDNCRPYTTCDSNDCRPVQ